MKTFYMVLFCSFLFILATQKMMALCEEEVSEAKKNQNLLQQIKGNEYQEQYLKAQKSLKEKGLL